MLFSKILVPVDFSRRSLGMVHYACKLGARYKAEVTLLNVIETPCYGVPGAGLELPAFAPVLPEWKAQHEARLDEFARAACPDVPVGGMVVEGNPAEKIAEAARTLEADLLTMPTHGYGAFRRLLIGSVIAQMHYGAAYFRDPKILLTFAMWLAYVAMIFVRRVSGLRGRRAVYLASAVFFCVLFVWVANQFSAVHRFPTP